MSMENENQPKPVLLSCRACGYDGQLRHSVTRKEMAKGIYHIACVWCGRQTRIFETREAAAAAWNLMNAQSVSVEQEKNGNAS